MGQSYDFTTFFGRERELSALGKLLGSGRSLVTLVGPAGIGKSRLSRHLLAEREQRGDACFFCDVRDATNTPELCFELARTLGLQLASGDTDECVAAVGDALGSLESTTLVLDNFEHLVDVVEPSTLHAWLAAAPAVRLLVTTRKRLRLRDATPFALAPMPLPIDEHDTDCTSVRLFVDRAEASEPAIRGSSELRRHGPEIVTMLEGMPLAIELAAGLARRMAPSEILEELQRQQLTLRAQHRDADPRHASLLSALASTWYRLTDAERRTARALTVFRGGFTLASAKAVIEPDLVDTDVGEAIDGLHDSSFLRTEDSTRHKRWALFEVTREFAAERAEPLLASEVPLERLRERHAHHMAERGEQWRAQLIGAGGMEARTNLYVERSNLAAARSWAREHDRSLLVSTSLSYARAISESTPQPAAQILSSLFDAESAELPRTRAEVLYAAATAKGMQGRLEEAVRDLSAAAEIEHDDPRLTAAINLERGRLAAGIDSEQARVSYALALEIAQRERFPTMLGHVHRNRASLRAELDHDEAAFDDYRIALNYFESVDDEYEIRGHAGRGELPPSSRAYAGDRE